MGDDGLMARLLCRRQAVCSKVCSKPALCSDGVVTESIFARRDC